MKIEEMLEYINHLELELAEVKEELEKTKVELEKEKNHPASRTQAKRIAIQLGRCPYCDFK